MYRTIYGLATAEIEVNRSRFMGFARHIESIEDGRSFLQEIRADHPRANHHVPAMFLGTGSSITEQCSDDGEPSGTAGRPALTVLRNAGLNDVGMVIVRYFGGVKLGTGGLVKAYTEIAQLVLAGADVAVQVAETPVVIQLGYAEYERIFALLQRFNLAPVDQEFGEEVSLKYSLPAQRVSEIERALLDALAGKLRWQLGETERRLVKETTSSG